MKVVAAIIRAPRAWTSSGRLARTYGAAAVREAAAAGLITCWKCDRSGKRLRAPVWTLTSKGARIYGVKVAEIPDKKTGMGTPFWSSGQEEDGRPRRRVQLATPRPFPEKADGVKGSVVKDSDGNALVLFGVEVTTDLRLGKTPPRRQR